MRPSGDLILIDIKVVPGSSKNGIAGIQGDRLRIRVAAAPEDGKANAELISFLSKLLGCPKKEITLISGEKSRLKTVAIPGGFEDLIKRVLNEF